jgi:hypothetical protein
LRTFFLFPLEVPPKKSLSILIVDTSNLCFHSTIFHHVAYLSANSPHSLCGCGGFTAATRLHLWAVAFWV